MRINTLNYSFLIILALSVLSCDSGPKVVEADQSDQSDRQKQETGIFSDAPEKEQETKSNGQTAPPVSEDVHKVLVKESLPTDKYVYLQVQEGDETYWIATVKQDVQTGETYFFKEGLLKTNFESKEYDRVFDRIYLVSNIVPANHGAGGGMQTEPPENSDPSEASKEKIDEPIRVEGSISIAELVEHPEKYAGQEVQVSGKCTKINPNIMNRHWIHLKDGTKDDFDLVLTSQTAIPEGAVVTMKGTVALDKDFGAGYRYDLIIENADLVR